MAESHFSVGEERRKSGDMKQTQTFKNPITSARQIIIIIISALIFIPTTK